MSDLERRLERAGRVLDRASAARDDLALDAVQPLPPRKPWLLAVAATLVVALGVGALVLQTRNRDTDVADEVTTSSEDESTSPTTTTAPPAASTTPATTSVPPTGTLPPTTAATTPVTTGQESTVPRPPEGIWVPVKQPAPAITPDPTRYERWPKIGGYAETAALDVVAAVEPQFSYRCIGVRDGSSTRHDACVIGDDGYAVVQLGDRLLVLALRTTTTALRVVTDHGSVTAPLLPTGMRTFEGADLYGTAVVVPAGTDVIGIDDEQFADCPYGQLFATGDLPAAFTLARCLGTVAVGNRGVTSQVAQSDSAYFRREPGGAWKMVSAGGDPCGNVAPGSEIDLSDRTPEEKAKIEAQLAELKQVCIALGEIPG